jgi:serine/threonine protein kinase
MSPLIDSTDELADESPGELQTAELDVPERAGGSGAVAEVQPSRPAPSVSSASSAPAASAAPRFDIVLRARYVLEAKIGEGGTSIVYRARDLRRDAAAPGGQCVALKLLRPGLRNQARAVERLKREFHHAQTLSHPHIARVYDLDCDGGAWFLTLELLEGETLAALLDRRDGALPPRRLLDILRACGEGLAFAHERGVVHGDFKPGNVFITTGGQVRVLDFGSASVSWLSAEAGLTATPAYASPEVMSGQRPERRDDIFSLACVALEMLTGRHPFGRRSALEARSANLAPERDWNLSDRQWHALEAGLAWTREERPASVRGLLADLTTVEAQIPLVIPEMQVPTSPFRAPRFAPFSAFAALAALTAVVFVANSQLSDLPGVVERTQEAARSLAALPSFDPESATGSPVAAEPQARQPQYRRDTTGQPARGVTAPAGTVSATTERRGTGAAGPTAGTRPARAEFGPHDTITRTRAAALAAFNGEDPVYEQSTSPGASALVSFDVEAITVSEGASSAVLRLNRRNRLDGRAIVLWRTRPGTARAGEDFNEITRGVAAFAAGQTTRAIYVPLRNDLAYERDETFVVELYGPNGTTRINPIARVLVNVRDNDEAMQFRVAEQSRADAHTQ